MRDFAQSILEAETLAGKLRRPPEQLPESSGPALRYEEPARPPGLAIAPARSVKIPPLAGMQDRSQRRRILHALANHELQAAELFAWAILAFPDTPTAFRRGLLAILAEEQLHCELYIECLNALGGHFGEIPVTGHFWHRLADIHTPLDFVCAMGLVFENANLDFAQDYRHAALQQGEKRLAEVLGIVHRDEVRHVAFAWRWLGRFKNPKESHWQAYARSLRHPLSPSRARGRHFDRSSRTDAGLDASFIDRIESAKPLRPNGRPR